MTYNPVSNLCSSNSRIPIFAPEHLTGYCLPAYCRARTEEEMFGLEEIRKSVAFVGFYDQNAVFYPKGTGFLVSVEYKGYVFNFLVTAEHVITKTSELRDKETNDFLADGIYIRFNAVGGGLHSVKTQRADWYFHPDTGETDVAVLPVSINLSIVEALYNPLEVSATKEIIDEYDMGIGDEIFMVGLFTNHFGNERNIPIIRIGNISAMPEEPVKTKYTSKHIDAYLIEARSIGGLSGSPVFIRRPPIRWEATDKTTKTGVRIVEPKLIKPGYMNYLIGLLHGHFDTPIASIDIVEEDSLSGDKLNTGIGVVIPIEKIIETINQEEIVRKMDEKVSQINNHNPGASPDFSEDDGEATLSGDKILENMLNTPPETHDEMKEKKK